VLVCADEGVWAYVFIVLNSAEIGG
jgi:hypothetical protein